MKHLPLGLFVAHLLFISGKSIYTPITASELGLSIILAILMCLPKVLKLKHKYYYRNYLLHKEELELKRPQEQDPDIARLEKENRIKALELNKFMTEQEYHKREISRAIEKKVSEGGVRF